MREKPALLSAAVGWTVTVYLAIAGWVQRTDPSSPAELAVANALLVLAGAVAIIAFVVTAVYVDAREARQGGWTGPTSRGRDDFKDV